MEKTCAAPDCNNTFVPKHPKRIYCSTRCRDRVKRRKYVLKWIKNGLCSQCGGEMDYPKSKHKNKLSPQYCSKCQEYFRSVYKNKKATVT